MNQHMRVLDLLLALLMTAGLLHMAAAGAEANEPLNLLGTWHGKLGLIEENQIIEENDVVITEQQRRRFFGTMMVGETEFDIAGTVSAAGVVSVIGDGVLEGTGTSDGLYQVEAFEAGAALLLGGLRLNGDNGASVNGAQFLLRQFDFDPDTDRPPPAVAGDWEGTFTSGVDGAEGTVSASFEQSSTRFVGSLSLIDMNVIEGSINGDGQVVIVAMAEPEHGIVVVLEGDFVAPPPPRDVVGPEPSPAEIQGIYRIFSIVEENNIVEENDLIDFGTFSIIAILIGM